MAIATAPRALPSAQVLDVSKPPDVGALLAGLNKTAPATKGKSKVPVIAGFEPLADEVAEKNRRCKQAETEAAMAEAQLLEVARAKYEQKASSGDFSKSLNFAGKTTAGVRVSFTDRFSAVPLDAKPPLVEALGDRYPVVFDEVRALTLKKTDDDSIRFLLERLGPEVFQEFFEVRVEIKAKDGFDQRQFELPESVRTLIRQAKPSVVAL